MNRVTTPHAAASVDESDDDTDGFLLDGFETIPGELLPFVEESQRRRRARRRRWLLLAAALGGAAAAACYAMA